MYAPGYITVMVGQLQGSGAQLCSVSAAHGYELGADTLAWHDLLEMREESLVWVRAPLAFGSFTVLPDRRFGEVRRRCL